MEICRSLMDNARVFVPLKNGQVTIIDYKDHYLMSDYNWNASLVGENYYRVSASIKDANNKWKTLYLHRAVLHVIDFSIEVDHIDAIGHLDISDPFNIDWKRYIYRMYCSITNLQALCNLCHKRKTSTSNASLRFQRKGLMREEFDDDFTDEIIEPDLL